MKFDLHPARWFESLDGGAVRCLVCPRRCRIPEGGSGWCGSRANRGGTLFSLSCGYPVALQIDPIEKKPLLHFRNGTQAFSIGTCGCNLGCVFCQNHHLSRETYHERATYRRYTPGALVDLICRHGCECVAFTFNEPTTWLEYAEDVAELARGAGISTILVSNGFINPEPAKELYSLMDAANIDVKGFTEEFYSEMCAGSLEPVKRTCEFYKNELGGHLELTYLVIPGKNDDEPQIDAFLDWVKSSLGAETPVHFTAYHPAYRYHDSPRTPRPLLDAIQAHAIGRGLPNVHLGNIC